ncbi:AAA domain-containing protein [Mycena olivaceomarginata]|nr:AAA domain-containing protein [Mycena olivaceomarginata]
MEQRTRIYVVGPSSTGKTTLCEALAKRLGLKGRQFITEVARRVITALGLSRRDIGLLDMQKAIMLAHLEQERANEESSAQLCDRSAVDPVVYAIFTAADPEDAKSRKMALVNLPEFQQALPRYRSSIFVLLTPVKEWVIDDGFHPFGIGIRYREIGPDMRFLPERTAFVLSLAAMLGN